MVNRMRPASDPATRAATPPPSVTTSPPSEARITAAKSEAEAQNVGGLHRWGRRWPGSRTPVATPTTSPGERPWRLACCPAPPTPRALLGDLGALADALRKEYKALDESLGELADAVAAAANGEAELAASLAELRAGSADDPEPIDHADALRQLLDPATRTSDVVLDPASGFRGSARERCSTPGRPGQGNDRSWWTSPTTSERGRYASNQALRRWFPDDAQPG